MVGAVYFSPWLNNALFKVPPSTEKIKCWTRIVYSYHEQFSCKTTYAKTQDFMSIKRMNNETIISKCDSIKCDKENILMRFHTPALLHPNHQSLPKTNDPCQRSKGGLFPNTRGNFSFS